MRNIAAPIFLVLLLLAPRAGAQTPTGTPQVLPKVTLNFGAAKLKAEIASTPEQEEIGLMYRKVMPDNSGMIFLLPVGRAIFWMKDTLIPLSIAFLDQKGIVLEIHDMQALDETRVYSESDQVAYALEMNLHWFALNHVKPGDKINPPPAAWLKAAQP